MRTPISADLNTILSTRWQHLTLRSLYRRMQQETPNNFVSNGYVCKHLISGVRGRIIFQIVYIRMQDFEVVFMHLSVMLQIYSINFLKSHPFLLYWSIGTDRGYHVESCHVPDTWWRTWRRPVVAGMDGAWWQRGCWKEINEVLTADQVGTRGLQVSLGDGRHT